MAASSTSITAGWMTPKPGRITIMVPRKPMVTAVQRWMPTGSRKTRAPSTVTMKGATKLTATASASGTKLTAMTNRVAELTARAPLTICRPGYWVRRTATPRSASRMNTPISSPNCRDQTI